jgi:activator of HSP90 ATPase
MSSAIHQERHFAAPPARVYRALIDAAEFSSATGGAPADIGDEPGATFSAFGGMVTGRQIELVPEARIVQAWRAASWPDGVYSVARFEFEADAAGTRVVFDHTGFPDGQREHLAAGWDENYWEPLARHLTAN